MPALDSQQAQACRATCCEATWVPTCGRPHSQATWVPHWGYLGTVLSGAAIAHLSE